jgi:prepilin-type N-terminal cleavage/methylation domain-containing protein
MMNCGWGRLPRRQTCFKRVKPFLNLAPVNGFTLPEVLIVIVLVGLLAAIAAVGWQSFWHTRLLTAAQDEVFQAMRQAQVQARRTHSDWQASFQNLAHAAQWTAHPSNTTLTEVTWNTFMPGIQIDETKTTLPRSSSIYRVEFDHRGHVPPHFGRLTLQIRNGGSARRCVFVSTLLGTLRKSSSCD